VSVQTELEDYVANNVRIPGAAFAYSYSTSGGLLFPSTLANFLNVHFSPHTPILPSHMLIGAGTTSVENMLAFTLGDVGDGILVSSPIYGRFELDFGNEAGLKIMYAEMGEVDSFEEDVVGCFEKTMEKAKRDGTSIRALLISNPSNPLGNLTLLRFCC
jgi:1-aminocyclopropane-1-carboxylate synthase